MLIGGFAALSKMQDMVRLPMERDAAARALNPPSKGLPCLN
jgi:hypothetical protein